MKKVLFATLALSLVFAFAAVADNHGGNTKCPVMGGKVNKAIYVDHKDKRIFLCCEGCIAEIKKDPAKYLKKIADAGEEPMALKAQSICPISGEELKNKDVYVDAKGKRVYVCCAGCVDKVKADPKKAMKTIADRGEYVESAPKKVKKVS